MRRLGGGFSKISANRFGCSTARNKGPTACTNLLTIRRDTLELRDSRVTAQPADGPRPVQNFCRGAHRRRVAALTHVLEADNAAEARERVRSLVETITLVSRGGGLCIEVRGELAAILRMAARADGRDVRGGRH